VDRGISPGARRPDDTAALGTPSRGATTLPGAPTVRNLHGGVERGVVKVVT
jgi:hypothetical protein